MRTLRSGPNVRMSTVTYDDALDLAFSGPEFQTSHGATTMEESDVDQSTQADRVTRLREAWSMYENVRRM